jgi:3-deoxy-D-manno-octulosonic acid kinase
MHPGNILVDGQDNVFFIDFDKATRYRGSRRALATRYLQRWRRAVAKYGLPQELDRLMAKDLSQQWNL